MEKSCGILAYRWNKGKLQVLLGKNGGPYNNDYSWNIPKGHVEGDEGEIPCAIREFEEETGLKVPENPELSSLGSSKTYSGKKTVFIFALRHDYNPNGDDVEIHSNTFTMEYPRNSGKFIEAVELESAKYIEIHEALEMIFPYQKVFLQNLHKDLTGTCM